VRLPDLTQRFMNKLKPMNIDWVLAAKNMQPWVEKILLEYMP
jgi:hypothetical protein